MTWTLDTLGSEQPGGGANAEARERYSLPQGGISSAGVKYDSYLRYYHTLRFLRPVQVYGRAWHKMVPKTQIADGAAPAIRQSLAIWRGGVRRESTMTGPTQFCFLNRTLDIAKSQGGWNLTCAPEKLWLLNLHYFDDLNATNADHRSAWHRELITSWIDQNPAGEGIGWTDSYAVSLRIVNWIKWHLNGNPLSQDALRSLANQTRHLECNLETYLLGNHVLANAKALIFAGVFFRGAEADRWRRRGLHLLERELQEEILADGGHFERSPMYHCIILEDLLDLFQLCRVYPDSLGGDFPDRLANTAVAMRQWLKAMIHPDGDISFFNDAALGIAPNAQALDDYAIDLGLPMVPYLSDGVTHLAQSGYIRWQKGALCAIVDVGEIGPDHIPGHAHADTLSFELSLFGRRTLVNSGTSAYKIEPARQQERGTAAHNTVTVDGQNSSEVWGAFRVARRARPVNIEIREFSVGLIIEAGHDGYLRLPGRVMHNRSFFFGERKVEIMDTLTGDFARAEARYHFHPGAVGPDMQTAESRPGKREFGSLACNACFDQKSGQNTIGGFVEPYSFHPGFGRNEPSQCLVLPIRPQPDKRAARTNFAMTWD